MGLNLVGPLTLRFLLTSKNYSSAWSQRSLGCGPWGSGVRSEAGGSAQAPEFSGEPFAVPPTAAIHDLMPSTQDDVPRNFQSIVSSAQFLHKQLLYNSQ